jgi:hypothetical protein
LTYKRYAVTCAALALTIIVVGCFAAQLYQQKSFAYTYSQEPAHRIEAASSMTSLHAFSTDGYTTLLTVPSTLTTAQSQVSSQTILANQTRSEIYNVVSQNPGLSFRALCSALCLPVGLAEYHLGVLVRSGLVSFVRDGRYKRFFIAKRFSQREMRLICLLRHKTARNIVEVLLGNRHLSHGKLAGEVAITSQALTWQMKTLTNTEFMLQVNDGLKTVYSLDEASVPMIRKYLAIVN